MTILSGGCQCGAVRFRCEVEAETASICHCRMCQKAFGSFYAPLVHARPGTLVWTHKEPTRFQSSNYAARGFCPECGTPLTYETAQAVSIAIGALDDPSRVPPVCQDGIEGKIFYVDELHRLIGVVTEDDAEIAALGGRLVSHQHPDAPSPDEA
ncbi:GFA family protein [Jiella sp. MQZ9-1]|uniref:GFA family protein n=1 Tax=Jiella flava TaxID=2816857 RepID=A0A939FWP7_9HYPH|nr:GFA family protein [Jiella flava]MBO0662907.1 GFA family protein [Jiella flava]MCD2471333.1 GFA family protein [Jiella flava]